MLHIDLIFIIMLLHLVSSQCLGLINFYGKHIMMIVKKESKKQIDDSSRKSQIKEQLVDIKSDHETTKRQLEEFRSKIPTDVAEGIEKALSELNEVKDKDLEPSEIETVRKAIEGARNAAMKIGQSMNQSSNNSSSSSETKENTENKDEEKKN